MYENVIVILAFLVIGTYVIMSVTSHALKICNLPSMEGYMLGTVYPGLVHTLPLEINER